VLLKSILELIFMDDSILLNDLLNTEANLFPLFSSEEEERSRAEQIPESVPVLPLRNTILYPGMIMPITVGRNKSIKLAQDYGRSESPIGIVTQKGNEIEDPSENDLYEVGTLSRILKLVSMPDGGITILVQGIKRFKVKEFVQTDPYYVAQIEDYPTNEFDQTLLHSEHFVALIGSIRDLITKTVKMSPNLPNEILFAITNIDSPVFLLHYVTSILSVELPDKYKVLELQDVEERAKWVLKLLHKELQLSELKNKIHNKSRQEMDKQQREYFLNEQMKAIQKELGGSPNEKATAELSKKAEKKKWNVETKELFDRELQKLQRTHNMSPDYSVQLNYLELLIDLPWNEYSKDNFQLDKARKVLDKDHFGLEKVKERIIEYLAVLKLKGDMKSPILCLAGPPGVGKTSLGKSIADALHRKYVRISLGGLRDESEIRGHRKTYIGAMPGRIIQSMRKAGYSNPVFVLDEIDKVLGMNVQGDPSAALLEVLDPEQNSTFYDNYLETTYDLSKILFIATANDLSSIHPALRDRMEIIDIPGYLLEEKIQIAKKHLIPKQLTEHGMKKGFISFTDKAIEKIIYDYTRESGVRHLEKNIAKIIRKKVAQYVTTGNIESKITNTNLYELLGVPLFQKDKAEENPIPGVVTGLAWTPVGGEILFVESITSMGKAGLTLTGNLGDVMKESATIAYEYLKAHAADYHIESKTFEEKKVHVHVPEGATPKDGPSAGITILTSLVSSFTQKAVRKGMAMTGEITLRGKLLPVGGIKEKILAAKRAGIYDIVLSSENKKDIKDIEQNLVEGMTFHYFDSMKEAVAFNLA
jgi:ATP-dependent Lon protease